jgi:hypothetical protein
MRSLQVAYSIPAGGQVNDVLTAAGINGYFGAAANITMYQNGDAAGLTINSNWDDGQDSKGLIPNGSAVGVASTAGKVKTNEDFFMQFAIPAGVKLLLNVQNPTGAPITYNAQLVIT